MSRPELQVVDDAEAAARAAAEYLVEAARTGGRLALSGGSTPGRAFELAAETEPDWSRAALWWGDERAVPPEDERSNYLLASQHLLDRLEGQPEVHRIRGELGAEAAAEEYERELDGVTLDLGLQGLGPDGHTASLFPGKAAVEERDRRVVAAEPGLEPWVDRVTLTIPALCAIPFVLFLVTGRDKADAACRAFADQPGPATPASLVRGAERTVVLLDKAAARYI